ncbi:MAG TPA: ShlB/FhaC/HecB family hemolysin secretion/activation protein [Devosia sp.]|nr:ShlB/FhaC/HecB family hemolysin secretion/activation protein [Devosia sp.]
MAQSASQITPNLTPRPIESTQRLVFSGGLGLGTPPGAEALTVQLRDVVIEGGRPELAAANEVVRATLSGRRVSVAEIFAKARDLEAAYSAAGYVLSRVVVPAQSLVDGGQLKLSVVDGFLESIDADNLPQPVRARVLATVEPLLRRPGVTMPEIERRLLLAGDTPGLGMKTALSTGKEPGGAILVIEGELKSVTGYVSLDNTLPAALGTWAVTGGIDFNSLFNAGETIYLRAAGHPRGNNAAGIFGLFDDDPQYRTLVGGIVVPLGLDGMTFNVEGTLTQTTPEMAVGPQASSQFERLSARLRYPFIRSRELTVNGGLIFDAQNEYQNIITGAGDLALSEDRLRVLRLTADGIWAPDWGTLTGSATFSLGLDAFGARSAASAGPVPLSRQGADDVFKKLEVALGYSQTLAPHFAVSLSARAQTSFGDALVKSEQFGIANLGELSTFDSGALTGDSGWAVRAEASAPFDLSTGELSLAAAPYVFAAVGSVYLAQPTVLESAITNAASVGAGVRLGGAIGQAAPTLTLEYGRAFRSDGPDSDRFTMVGAVQF